MLCHARYSSVYLGVLVCYSGQSRLTFYGILTGGTFMMDRELIQPRSVPSEAGVWLTENGKWEIVDDSHNGTFKLSSLNQ
jgi:hypothetical protein